TAAGRSADRDRRGGRRVRRRRHQLRAARVVPGQQERQCRVHRLPGLLRALLRRDLRGVPAQVAEPAREHLSVGGAHLCAPACCSAWTIWEPFWISETSSLATSSACVWRCWAVDWRAVWAPARLRQASTSTTALFAAERSCSDWAMSW